MSTFNATGQFEVSTDSGSFSEPFSHRAAVGYASRTRC